MSSENTKSSKLKELLEEDGTIKITTYPTDDSPYCYQWCQKRFRFNQFEQLRNNLATKFPKIMFPLLPYKEIPGISKDPFVVEKRTIGLQRFMNRLLACAKKNDSADHSVTETILEMVVDFYVKPPSNETVVTKASNAIVKTPQFITGLFTSDPLAAQAHAVYNAIKAVIDKCSIENFKKYYDNGVCEAHDLIGIEKNDKTQTALDKIAKFQDSGLKNFKTLTDKWVCSFFTIYNSINTTL